MAPTTIKGFDDYLQNLSSKTFQTLYQQPATALAIFRRMLPSLAKIFVTTLLYNELPIPLAELQAWVKTESYREREDAFSKLRRLHMTQEDGGNIFLDPVFKRNFRLALTGGGNHYSFGVPVDTSEDKKKVTVAHLDSYAANQFDCILHYMVEPTGPRQPNQGVKMLLATSGLMNNNAGSRGFPPKITQTGFSFILQEGNAQIWVLLIQYLEMCENLAMEKTDVLHFLLMLGSLELGQAYSTETLTETQIKVLADLRDYGVVYQRKSTPDRFYPTRLATTLTSDVTGLRTAAASFAHALAAVPGAAPTEPAPEDQGFIVIETNYRVYAYTNSPLSIAILDLFSKLGGRFPNLVTAKLTRASIQRAIANGITADQIIDYLKSHAHPVMRKNSLVLPPTVVDQIRLWQIEGERMKTTTGFLFKDFATAWDFEDTAKYAEDHGILTWKDAKKRLMFVTRTEQIVDYLTRRDKQRGQATR
ncbi:transcription factor Tfb2-domain-containing protein [Tricharina praecox]|uniref:transcription factor Tfb2-domain-containing protein n=1 Tax=Tricharina praecox TaxID=43433 RepID=UPI00221F96E3|nr:transcription factor Tfb2-domain-containing protein [Tricharina praecox]KAI5843623.1 transcription factor Tfb2-domain-containing protein [Tricharina praecox]